MMLALTLAAAVAVGLSLGLLGGGGSILTVPLLIYVAGVAPAAAIAMSLFVVGTTSLAALVPHARAGRVRWRVALPFGAAGMVGAYVGGRVAALLPAGVLLVAFAAMMAVTAMAMLRRGTPTGPVPGGAQAAPGDAGRRWSPRRPSPRPWSLRRSARTAGLGVAVGAATGLVGAGGGFVVVPALVLLGGLPMPAAVGTSLAVIAANSAAGLLGHLHSGSLDWGLTSAVTAMAVLGSLAGSRLSGRIDPGRLRRVFGWFVVAMAAVVLAGQMR